MVCEEGEEEGCMNKQMCTKKVVKLPQRGPGVAELEKILREQKHNKEEDSFSSSVFPLPHNNFHPHSNSSSSLLCPTPPPQPPLQTVRPQYGLPPVISVPKHAHLTQKLDFIHGGGGGGGGYPPMGSQKNGSFLPTMWKSCESNSDEKVPKPDLGCVNMVQLTDESDLNKPSTTHMLQRNCLNYLHPMMNHYPTGALPASSTSSAGNHHVERPSNQRSHHNYTSMRPEEEKMVGLKRPLPFSDYPPSSSIHYKVPLFSPHLIRPDQPSASSNRFTSHSEPNITISRDPKRRCQSDLSSNKCIDQNGPVDGNILTLGPPKTPLPPSSLTLKEEFSGFQLSLHNESIEDRFQRSGQGGKSNIGKPFYSFLQPKKHLGHEETTLSLDNGKHGGQSLDLNLKL